MIKKDKFLEINLLENKLIKSETNTLVIFYADWCPFCISNLPIIKETILEQKIKNYFFINISDESLDVWLEDGNTKWAVKLVPTIRVYKKMKIVFNHENVIEKNELVKVIKKYCS